MNISSIFGFGKKKRELEEENQKEIEVGRKAKDYVRNEIKRIIQISPDDKQPELLIAEVGDNIFHHASNAYTNLSNEGIIESMDTYMDIGSLFGRLAVVVKDNHVHVEDVRDAFTKGYMPDSMISANLFVFCRDASHRINELIKNTGV